MITVTLLLGLLTSGLGDAYAAGTEDSAVAPPTMQWQVRDLVIERQVAPSYPQDMAPSAEPVSCVASVRIGGDGVPLGISVDDCPAAFAVETHRALSDWRWSAWSSVAERRVTLRVRFPTAAVAAMPAVGSPALSDVASTPTTASWEAPASREPRVRTDQVVCSGTIKRNRRGEARGVAVATCPPAFVDAAEEAMKELGKQDAPRADRGDVVIRTQPVQVTFRLGDL